MDLSYLFIYLNEAILVILVLFILFFGVRVLRYFIAKTKNEESGIPASKIQEFVLDSIKEVQQTLTHQYASNQQRICSENADKTKDATIDTIVHTLVDIDKKEEENISKIEEVIVDAFLGEQIEKSLVDIKNTPTV
jgi:glutamyl-tRNA reductase